MRTDTTHESQSAFTVTRCFPVDETDIEKLERALTGNDAIEAVARHRLCKGVAIRYDSARVGYADIELALAHAGIPLRHSRWTRIKAGWFRFVDENAKSNAASKGGACCSRPPGIYGGRHKD